MAPEVHYDQANSARYDAVIPQDRGVVTPLAAPVIRQFEPSAPIVQRFWPAFCSTWTTARASGSGFEKNRMPTTLLPPRPSTSQADGTGGHRAPDCEVAGNRHPKGKGVVLAETKKAANP